MPANFTCSCSAVQSIPDDHAGKQVQCYLCGEVSTVPGPAIAQRPVPADGPVRPWQAADTGSGSVKAKSNSKVMSGEIMMIVAMVWFIGGLVAEVIFFYPLILFVVGLVTCFQGLGEKPD